MKRFDYFKNIENKYKNRYSVLKPLVIRLDGVGVTKNKRINLIDLDKDSFRYNLNQTAKILSQKYNCISYVHCDEISFIFKDPSILKEKYNSIDIQKINSVFSQEVSFLFYNLSKKKTYFDCRCFNIKDNKIQSYLNYRMKSAFNTINQYVYKKYIPKTKQQNTQNMNLEFLIKELSSNLELYKNYNDSQLYGVLYDRGNQLNIDLSKIKSNKIENKNFDYNESIENVLEDICIDVDVEELDDLI